MNGLYINDSQSLLIDSVLKCGFRSLSVADKELFAGYYKVMNDNWASSISFASMIAWNKSIRIYHRVIGEYLCCLAQDTTCDRWVLLPLLGYYEKDRLAEAIKELQIIIKQLGIPFILTDVSEWMLPYYLNLKCIKLKASYDLGLSDYIYTAREFEQGLNRPHSRYDYNYFVRKNNPELVVMDYENCSLYLQFLKEAWCSYHECSYCQYGCLLDSTQNIIQNFAEVAAKGVTVFVNKQIVGYTIVTQERHQLIFQFKESNHKYRGLSEYMHWHCYQLFGEQAKVINYTEDLNFSGLRRYKQNLAPFSLQHKYELSIKCNKKKKEEN